MITRLFIDPGTRSLGFSVFVDNVLEDSGTVLATFSKKVPLRLKEIRSELKKRLDRWYFDEVHIEKLNRKTHYYVIWCVGMLVELFGYAKLVDDDIAVPSWKSFYGLKQRDKGAKVREKFEEIEAFSAVNITSDDQLEAILLGYFYLNKKI